MSQRAPLLPVNEIKRMPEVMVGDLIQYRYRYSYMGTTLTTRTVTEVFDEGASFTVEGGYPVSASDITAHIPIDPAEGEEMRDDDDEFTRP